MPYTLTKGLLWFLLALALGLIVGWLLRSIRATTQLRAARGARHDAAEVERLRARVAELEAAQAATRSITAAVAADTVAVAAEQAAGPPGETPGESPVLPGDDLTAVDGIDDEVAALLHGIGVHTFGDLADTEVSLLRTLLAEAGPERAERDPAGWPEQARQLAAAPER